MKPQVFLVAASLSLAAAAPLNALVTLTKQPTNQVVSLGAHVTNTVTATSTAPPLTYQWYGQGALLPEQTSRTLVLKSIQAAQGGEYYVVVSDADHQPVQSETARITVDRTFEKITEGPLVTDVETTESSTWWDYDHDGFLDVIVHRLTASFGSGVVQSFYHNEKDGTFTKISTNAIAQTLKNGLVGSVGDLDNDGDQDIYLTSNYRSSGEPLDDLFRNEGGGRFTALVGQPWNREQDHSFDSAFVDHDGDGLLDVFVMNFLEPPCLYRQSPSGTFTKLTAAQVGSLLENPGDGYNAAWVDYDNDGDLDLWMQHAEGDTRLHRNDGNGFFSLATPASFAQAPGGWGIWADFDNDGNAELFVGGGTGLDWAQSANALYHRLPGQDFTNVATESGVAVSMAACASAVGDYDNDGWLDIFAAEWQGGQPNALFHNHGDGTFERLDVGSPIWDGEQRWGHCRG